MVTAADQSTRFDPERYTWWFATGAVAALALSFFLGWGLVVLGVVLLATTCRVAGGQYYLFGPYFELDLKRVARRWVMWSHRMVVALVAGVPLIILYSILISSDNPSGLDVPTVATIGFLCLILIIGYVGMIAIPQEVYQLLADGRESRFLELVLLTDLRNRELIAGRMILRMYRVITNILTVMPVICLLPVLFGVEPAIIIYTLAYASVTFFSAASIFLLDRVLAVKRSFWTNVLFLIMTPYLLITTTVAYLVSALDVWFVPLGPDWAPQLTVGDLVDWLTFGNPIGLITVWVWAGWRGEMNVVAAAWPAYAAFHTVVALSGLMLATNLYRRMWADIGGPDPTTPAAGSRPPPPRPAVTDEPIAWRECYCHHSGPTDRSWFSIGCGWLFVGVPAVIGLISIVAHHLGVSNELAQVTKIIALFIAFISSLTATNTGVESIARERERDTFISLVLTPLSARDIITQKFRGLMRYQTNISVVVAVLGLLTVLAGVLPWWAYLGLLVYYRVLLARNIATGLYFSAAAPSCKKASDTAVAYQFGSLVRWGLVIAGLLLVTGGPYSPLVHYVYGVFSIAPIVAIGVSDHIPSVDVPYWAAGFLIGLTVQIVSAVWYWRAAIHEFEAAINPSSPTGPILDTNPTKKERAHHDPA